MHTLDILFIIAALFFIIVGVRRGLVGELFRLLALVAGFVIAFLKYPDVSAHFHFSPEYLRTALAFSCIYIVVAIAVIVTGLVVKKVVHITPLGWVDSLSGGAIGIIKTVLIFWIICLSFSALPQSSTKMNLRSSMVYRSYNRLPRVLMLDGITGIRNAVRKKLDRDIPREVRKTKQQIEHFSDKVDSMRSPIKKIR